jgi:hypothetical protein
VGRPPADRRLTSPFRRTLSTVTRTPNARPPHLPTRLAFHASRIVIDVGVLLVLGAMSLPFVSAGDSGQRAVAADALPALLLVLPIFVITLLPDHARPIPTVLGWLSLLLAATALPYAVVKYLDASALAGTLGGSVGMGARILVFGTFATLAGLVLGLIRNFLGLPVAGTYPARPEPTAAEASGCRHDHHPSADAGIGRSLRRNPAPPQPGGRSPARRRPGAGPARYRPDPGCRASALAGGAPSGGRQPPAAPGVGAGTTSPRGLRPRHGADPPGSQEGSLVAGRSRRPLLLSRAPVAHTDPLRGRRGRPGPLPAAGPIPRHRHARRLHRRHLAGNAAPRAGGPPGRRR